jgi:hypothetical protein
VREYGVLYKDVCFRKETGETTVVEELILQKKRNFNRIIVKTNSSSLSDERMEQLRRKINDPNYVAFAIERLADNISKAMLEGYIDQKELQN